MLARREPDQAHAEEWPRREVERRARLFDGELRGARRAGSRSGSPLRSISGSETSARGETNCLGASPSLTNVVRSTS